MSTDEFPKGPTCPKLSAPIAVPDDEAFVAPATVARANAEVAAKAAILESFFRPSDIGSAALDRARLIYAPFWRVHVNASGFHLDLVRTSRSDGRPSFPLPSGGTRTKDAVVMVCARRLFPYDPRSKALASKMTWTGGSFGPFEVSLSELAPRRGFAFEEGEEVEADVPRTLAEREAQELLRHSVEPRSAIYSKYESHVLSAAFCLYPLWAMRYRYNGEARSQAGEECFVALSGRTGKVLASHHPSALRAVSAKVRKWLSF